MIVRNIEIKAGKFDISAETWVDTHGNDGMYLTLNDFECHGETFYLGICSVEKVFEFARLLSEINRGEMVIMKDETKTIGFP